MAFLSFLENIASQQPQTGKEKTENGRNEHEDGRGVTGCLRAPKGSHHSHNHSREQQNPHASRAGAPDLHCLDDDREGQMLRRY